MSASSLRAPRPMSRGLPFPSTTNVGGGEGSNGIIIGGGGSGSGVEDELAATAAATATGLSERVYAWHTPLSEGGGAHLHGADHSRASSSPSGGGGGGGSRGGGFGGGGGGFGGGGGGGGSGGAGGDPTPVTVANVASGHDTGAVITSHGFLFTWGRGNHGSLGHGGLEHRYSPTLVADLGKGRSPPCPHSPRRCIIRLNARETHGAAQPWWHMRAQHVVYRPRRRIGDDDGSDVC